MKREKILTIIIIITGVLNSVCAGSLDTLKKPLNDLKDSLKNVLKREIIFNLTPQSVSQNPSNKYTITMRTTMKDLNVKSDSHQVSIVIDGETHPMKLVDPRTHTFTYEYEMPKGRNSAFYYYDLNYDVQVGSKIVHRWAQSKLFELDLTNRYVISMESERGVVGSEIPIVGRGFQEGDKVIIGGIEAETFYESPNAIAFEIPALQADRSYKVEVLSSGNLLPVGQLFVDSADMEVNLASVNVQPNEKTELVFNLLEKAPGDGLVLDVTTDIPLSIIMPEITIPGGERSVTVMVEGGEPGEGYLFVNAHGYREKVIPIVVNS